MTQKEYEERMKNTRYKELKVTKAEDKKDYVFISYRGNSWEKVLTDIVYKLQKEYGLRIYFDKDFATSNNIWIEQFTDNMESKYCKAFLCFFDEGYVTSYATLLELMYAMNGRCKNLHGQMYAINFPIDWDKLNDKDDDTGLGSPDNNNPGWREEKQEFDEAFELLKEENDYKDIRKYYSPRKKLKVCNCKDIMAVLQPKNRREYVDTDDFYKQFIVDPLKKSCPSVFEEITKEEQAEVTVNKIETKSVNAINIVKPEISQNTTRKDDTMINKNIKTVCNKIEKNNSADLMNKFWDEKDTKLSNAEKMRKAFSEIVSEYEDKVLLAVKLGPNNNGGITFVALKDDVDNNIIDKEWAKRFVRRSEVLVNNHKFYVNATYNSKDSKKQIEKLLEFCNRTVDCGSFTEKDYQDKIVNDKTELFIYKLFEVEHTAERLADMMNDVFKTIAEKDPDKILEIYKKGLHFLAVNGDEKSKTDHFKAANKYKVGEMEFCVSAHYGREDGKKQLRNMIAACGYPDSSFEIISEPPKKTKNKYNTGNDSKLCKLPLSI